MSRLRRIADSDRIFFITSNLAPGVAHLTAVECDVVLEQLKLQRADGEFWLFGYVVMPSHLHLLMRPNGAGMAAVMHRLKRFTAQSLSGMRGRRGPLWQARYFDFVLRRVDDFGEKLEYIHNNPVEAKLVAKPEDWRWSSAAYYFKSGDVLVPVDPVELSADRDALLSPDPWC